MAMTLGPTRRLMYERNAASVSKPLLIALVFWLAALFVSLGLFGPPNATVIAAFWISALSISTAILFIVEISSAGLI
jgi:hypothetical protein